MNRFLAQIRHSLLGLSVEETNYTKRGFRGASEGMRARLEQIGTTFVSGYHAALKCSCLEELVQECKSTDPELRGFAFEGAAMGLGLLDTLTPWRTGRIPKFLQGPGNDHAYMVHVGVGWIWARLPISMRVMRKKLDPMLQWLAFDGWGFHEGFFHWPNYVGGEPAPDRLSGYERRAFDQGFGRSLWFVNGGNVPLLASTIANFAAERRADLWSGVGLAATYAGMVSLSALGALRQVCGAGWPALAQGAAFAAKARQRAGNLTEYTNLAAKVLCGISAVEAANLCDTTLENLPLGGPDPPYELWRRRLQDHFQTADQLQVA